MRRWMHDIRIQGLPVEGSAASRALLCKAQILLGQISDWPDPGPHTKALGRSVCAWTDGGHGSAEVKLLISAKKIVIYHCVQTNHMCALEYNISNFAFIFLLNCNFYRGANLGSGCAFGSADIIRRHAATGDSNFPKSTPKPKSPVTCPITPKKKFRKLANPRHLAFATQHQKGQQTASAHLIPSVPNHLPLSVDGILPIRQLD